jgi:hypothetical protein
MLFQNGCDLRKRHLAFGCIRSGRDGAHQQADPDPCL